MATIPTKVYLVKLEIFEKDKRGIPLRGWPSVYEYNFVAADRYFVLRAVSNLFRNGETLLKHFLQETARVTYFSPDGSDLAHYTFHRFRSDVKVTIKELPFVTEQEVCRTPNSRLDQQLGPGGKSGQDAQCTAGHVHRGIYEPGN